MYRLSAEHIQLAIQRLAVAHGLSAVHAEDLANTLVETSLCGIDTHGIRLLPTYLCELEGGRANPTPRFRMLGEFAAAGVFDADHALGVVAANAAMREAMSRASRFGVAALAVANSNHLGAAGYYARLAARRNQIGLVFSNSDALVVPAGGAAPLNGTNPIAMAAPGLGEDEFLLDMATTQVAYSLVMDMLSKNQALPPGWAADEQGHDATRGGRVTALQPLGGYKGQGLGTMVQILCALLASMPLDAELTHLYHPPYDEPRRISHFFIAIELRAFTDVSTFRGRITELLDRFRSSPPAKGVVRVTVGGDPERRVRAARRVEGIPLTASEHDLLAPYLEMPARDPVVSSQSALNLDA